MRGWHSVPICDAKRQCAFSASTNIHLKRKAISVRIHFRTELKMEQIYVFQNSPFVWFTSMAACRLTSVR